MVEEHDKEVSQELPCQMSINGYDGRGSVVEDLLTNKLTTESNASVGEMKDISFGVKVTCFLFPYAAITTIAVNCNELKRT